MTKAGWMGPLGFPATKEEAEAYETSVWSPTRPVTPTPISLPDLKAGDEVVIQEAGLGGLVAAAVGVIAGLLAGDEVVQAVGGGVTTALAAPGTSVVPGTTPIVNGVPISGPGVPEPPAAMVSKAWHIKFESQKYGTFQMFYWRLIDGRIMSYHSPTKTWKIWRPKKHIVISKDPRVSNLRKLGRLNKRVEKMLKPFQPKDRKGLSARALSRTYLSTAERRLLEAGGK